MPNYDYSCTVCGSNATEYRTYEERNERGKCACGEATAYKFPMQAALGFQPFETYYDEGLDCDISGMRERQQVMKAMGLQEAGDSVHGARNWDQENPHAVKEQKPIGRRFSDIQRERQRGIDERDNFTVQPVDKDNKVIDTLKWSELDSA